MAKTSTPNPPKGRRESGDERAPQEGAGAGMSRRLFLKGSAAASAAVASGVLTSKAVYAEEDDHGVASGDPQSNAVTLWTRVPQAFQTPGNQLVSWEVSTNEDFAAGSIVVQGSATTSAERDFTVKVRAEGLSPFTYYWYRFRTVSGYQSVTGRTLTAPRDGDDPGNIRFAFVSCAHYGPHFNVYGALAQDDLHFCAHLGDTVYEHTLGYRAKSLTDWRSVHKLYLTNPDLREVRRLFPWIYTWDDHEVYNNFNGGASEEEVNEGDRDCQAAAYQAFWEYMPLDVDIEPTTTEEGIPHLAIHRRIKYGRHLDLFALDGRQYKDGVICGRDFLLYSCEDLQDPDRTLLGQDQTEWLCEGLAEDRATWKVLLNQTVMMGFKLTNNMRPIFDSLMGDQLRQDTDGLLINADQWDGYPQNRDRILGMMDDMSIPNLIVCTGDIHNCYVGELKADFTARRSDACGVEFVTGSVTSDGVYEIVGGRDLGGLMQKALRPANPHLKWLDAVWHTYTRVTITPSRAYATYIGVSTIESPDYESFVVKEFEVPEGQSRLIFEP